MKMFLFIATSRKPPVRISRTASPKTQPSADCVPKAFKQRLKTRARRLYLLIMVDVSIHTRIEYFFYVELCKG